MKKTFVATLASAMTVFCLSASANPFGSMEAELSKIGVEANHLEKVINSHTLKAARKMCLVSAHHALEEKAIAQKKYSEIAAHCALGNLHTALELMGGNVHDDVVHSTHVIIGGVQRHVHKWEHEAADLWHKIK
jgi:hypothetical protein